MTGNGVPAGAVKILSPVTSLLGGVTPAGMVCSVDGVCAPADANSSSTPEQN
ncbi:hypothetical protein [Subtercola boreus]|uniref:hypothetical protein n=1 Tax=Subtercola boreus TaxID=120213 RepID=UPI001558EEBB|nr:hypothetical protein [Subtercola boreus]